MYKCSKKNMKNMNQLEVNYTHVNMYMHTHNAGTALCPAEFFFPLNWECPYTTMLQSVWICTGHTPHSSSTVKIIIVKCL